jgi:hypothetical protein
MACVESKEKATQDKCFATMAFLKLFDSAAGLTFQQIVDLAVQKRLIRILGPKGSEELRLINGD